MRILVVEDDSITRLAVKSQLENPGNEMPVGGTPHVVIAVPGPAEAEAALERESFDYAFIDLKLGTDRGAGKEVLGAIVRNHPATICIMMTSNSADEALEECLKAGAAEYIIKPFEFRIVHDIMRKARIVHRLWKQNRALRLRPGRALSNRSGSPRSLPSFSAFWTGAATSGKQNSLFLSPRNCVGKEVSLLSGNS